MIDLAFYEYTHQVPGSYIYTNIILVTQHKEYVESFANKGHEFERMILGQEEQTSKATSASLHSR
jgi:hypothetical protein